MNLVMNLGMKKKGLLLLNLGTPDGPDPEAVGRYLREFLMDRWVVDVPWPLRWFLVNVIIVPRRKFVSSENYRKIWTDRGSPLLFHLQDLAKGVAERFGADWVVEIAMRYGNPNIESGLRALKAAGVSEILVVPLYPQYAESTTRSSRERCEAVARELELGLPLSFLPPFYDHPEYIKATAEVAREGLGDQRPSHFLFSFHGVPERHVKRTDSTGSHCLAQPGAQCCARVGEANRDCYRAHCYATARLLATELGLEADEWSLSFQSRLGRTPWIRPYTEDVLKELASQGVKRIAVLTPSFAADCLETLEEIAERGAEQFHEDGGDELVTLPCLNSHPRWVEALRNIIRA